MKSLADCGAFLWLLAGGVSDIDFASRLAPTGNVFHGGSEPAREEASTAPQMPAQYETFVMQLQPLRPNAAVYKGCSILSKSVKIRFQIQRFT